MLLHLEICQQSRPWECSNPEGISKECGKGGKPTFWLSVLLFRVDVQPAIRKLTLNLPQSRVFGRFTSKLPITPVFREIRHSRWLAYLHSLCFGYRFGMPPESG